MVMAQVLQRLRQAVNHLDPRPLPATVVAWVGRHLSSAEQALFFRMCRGDQRHCVAVAQRVARSEGLSLRGRWVATRAALLHDVGKSAAPSGLLVRAAPVLFQRGWPRWVPHVLRERVAALRNHPARGAAMLRRAGTDLAVTTLVRCHEDDGEVPEGLQPLLLVLRRADGEE